MHSPSWMAEDLKACLFDFGGTLDADGTTWQDRFYPLYQKQGFQIDREQFRFAFYQADDSLKEIMPTRKSNIRETLEMQVTKVFKALTLTPEASQIGFIVENFLNGMKKHIERNRPLLGKLKKQYALGIISNFYGNLDVVTRDLGIDDLFDCIIDSSLEGVMKPDPEIFHAALSRLSIAPDQAVFIGDNIYRDMEGAKAIGMPHIFLAGEFQFETKPCCAEDPIIHSLPEIQSLLLAGHTTASPREAS